MKTKLIKIAAIVLMLGCWTVVSSQAQNMAIVKKSARTAASGVAVSTTNGKTTIVYQGKEVWSGKTTGKVTSKSKAVDGKTYLAVFDGEKVIWENVPGAAKQVK